MCTIDLEWYLKISHQHYALWTIFLHPNIPCNVLWAFNHFPVHHKKHILVSFLHVSPTVSALTLQFSFGDGQSKTIAQGVSIIISKFCSFSNPLKFKYPKPVVNINIPIDGYVVELLLIKCMSQSYSLSYVHNHCLKRPQVRSEQKFKQISLHENSCRGQSNGNCQNHASSQHHWCQALLFTWRVEEFMGSTHFWLCLDHGTNIQIITTLFPFIWFLGNQWSLPS